MPGFARLYGSFQGHPKRRIVGLAADGLLSRAMSYAAEYETDGFVDTTWVAAQIDGDPMLTRRQKRELLDFVRRGALLEEVAAGETRELVAPKTVFRKHEVTVTLGPWSLDGYLVHDYLHCNYTSGELAQKRAGETGRKRGQRAQQSLPWADVSRQDTPALSRIGRDSGTGGGGSTATTEPVAIDARASERAPGLVGEVMAVLRRCERLSVPDHCETAIESAIAAHDGKDAIAAAHAAVTRAADPTWRMTWGPSVFAGELARQHRGTRAGPTGGKRFDSEREDRSPYENLERLA